MCSGKDSRYLVHVKMSKTVLGNSYVLIVM